MSFQIKDFVSIVAAQINHARSVTDKVTDFAPGSVVRTLMEAPAVEVEELYIQMFLGLRDAIPVATFLSFGFEKLPARRAYGFASVSADAPLPDPIEIPAGTLFQTDAGGQYTTTDAVTWAAGEDVVRVPVQAVVAGVAGNVAVGEITTCDLFPPSEGYTVSNPLIASGSDAESDAEREARFAEFIGALSRGTVSACLYGAGQATVLDEDGNINQFVARIGYTEIPGRMRIYLYSNFGVASAELLAAAQEAIDGSPSVPGYRPAGVRVDVLPMDDRAVPMGIQVGMLSGFAFDAAVEQEIADIYDSVIRAVPAGDTLYLGTLVEKLLGAAGVSEIVLDATANITCAASESLVPGTLSVTELA